MDELTITLRRPTPRKSLGYVRGSILDVPGGPGWERLPGAVVRVFFSGIPLSSWQQLSGMEAVEALDGDLRPLGISYRVAEWHTGGTRPSPTGRELHLVYATLRCLGPIAGSAGAR